MALSEPYSTDKEPIFRTLFAFGCSLAVDRSHERLVVVLTRGDAFGRDFVYAHEVLLSERYVYSGGVLLQVLATFGAWNRDDVLTLVQKPRQRKRFESARRLSLCPSIDSTLPTEKVSDARVGAWQQ